MVEGGYASKVLAHPSMSFPLPAGVDDAQALALGVQGLTVWHLLRTSARIQPGESVVVHAAAGGVGTLAVQLAKLFGAGRVIGLASTPHKRDLAAELGADVTLDPAEPDLTAALVQANGGDQVRRGAGDGRRCGVRHEPGRPRAFGRLVTFGEASHEQPTPVERAKLFERSIAVIGFWFVYLMERPELLREPLAEMLDLVEQGRLRPVIGGHYPLEEAHRTHEDLLSRATIGKLVLDV